MKKHPASVARIEPLEARIAPAVIAEIALNSLAASAGFKLQGAAAGDFAGGTVSNAGDVNGDGYADFLVSGYNADEGGTDRGAIFVLFGKPDGTYPSNVFSALGGDNGFKVTGVADGDLAGFSAAAAGDVNNDGFGDIIIGAHLANEGGSDRGAAYVIYGKAGNFTAEVKLASLNSSVGFKIAGLADGDTLGFSVSGAGDVNSDGFDDIIIGAPGSDEGGNDRGAVYVVFGKQGGFAGASFNLAGINGTNGYKISGAANNDQLGYSVGSAGRQSAFNQNYVIVGAIGADEGGTNRGAAYVVSGGTTPIANKVVSSLSGNAGFKLSGVADNDSAGVSVRGAGDVNGDGLDDLIIGAQLTDTNGTNSGAAYVVFGAPVTTFTNVALASLNGTNGFKLTGAASNDIAGFSVSPAGDVNADGIADLIVGASGSSGGAGAAYVVFGKKGGFTGSVPLSGINGTNGFKVTGYSTSSTGISVSGAGDINGDGFADLIVGAPGLNEGGNLRGAAFIVNGFGTADVTITPGGKSATFNDWDGDLVTIKTTKGTLEVSQFKLSSPNPLTGGANLVFADFASTEFAGAALTFTSKPGNSSGDGLVNVGTLNADGVAFASVGVDGNLRKIEASSVGKLSVFSLGLLSGEGVSGGPLASEFTGHIGALNVKTDWNRAALDAGSIGTLKVGGTMRVPVIDVFTTIGSLVVAGNLDGGFDNNISLLMEKVGSIAIGGSILNNSFIIVTGHVGKVTVGGSWTGQFSVRTAGPVVVKGALEGLFMSVSGVINPGSAAKAVALKSLTVGGSVQGSSIFGGDITSPDVSFGPVLVKGQWISSSISAGVREGPDFLLGTADDMLFPGHTAIVSKIASITIGGAVSGRADSPQVVTGFFAEEIGSLKIGNAVIPLQKGARNDTTTRFLGVTGDVRVREVAV